MNIPLVDLKKNYLSIKKEIDFAINRIIETTAFIQGNEVKSFEDEFAQLTSSNEKVYCASCGNGTDALMLALKALKISKGDEVITVVNTFIATAEAIISVGAKPVFVDIDPQTMLIDVSKIEEKITSKTKAIIVVHLYGQPCDMDELGQICKRHNLLLIEDAAQAHGAKWRGKKVGSFGDAACFSFFPGKNLGCFGDGGAVVSKDERLIKEIKRFSNHGREKKYVHLEVGINSRLDALQAAILRVKLKYLEIWNKKRNDLAKYYLSKLKDLDFILPEIDINANSVWHLFVVRSENRDDIIETLKENGIDCGIHYPIPLHLQPALKNLGYKLGDFPIAEKIASQIFSLPIYPELGFEDIDFIINLLTKDLVNV